MVWQPFARISGCEEQGGDNVTAFAQICSSAGEAEAPIPAPALARFKRIAEGFETDSDLQEWLEHDLIWCAAPSVMTQEEAATTAAEMRKAGFTTEGYARQLAAIRHSGDRTDFLKRISAPSLILGAHQDRCLTPESSHHAHALIPGSELRMIDGVGHSLDAAILDHLKGWLVTAIRGERRKTPA